MVNDKYKELLKILVDVALIVSVILMIFQTIATRDAVTLTKDQMETTLRPWIGRGSFLKGVPSQDINSNPIIIFSFFLKNYGGMPALNSTGTYAISDNLSGFNGNNHQIRDMQPSSFGAIMPGEDRLLSINIPTQRIKDADNKTTKLYLLVLMNYEYPKNKFGTYWVIAEYDANVRNFNLVEDKIE